MNRNVAARKTSKVKENIMNPKLNISTWDSWWHNHKYNQVPFLVWSWQEFRTLEALQKRTNLLKIQFVPGPNSCTATTFLICTTTAIVATSTTAATTTTTIITNLIPTLLLSPPMQPKNHNHHPTLPSQCHHLINITVAIIAILPSIKLHNLYIYITTTPHHGKALRTLTGFPNTGSLTAPTTTRFQ